MWVCEDVSARERKRRCEYEDVSEDVKMWRCECEREKEKMWVCEDIKMCVCVCEDVSMWRCKEEDVICEDVKMWRREDVSVWLWRCEDVWQTQMTDTTIRRTLRSETVGKNWARTYILRVDIYIYIYVYVCISIYVYWHRSVRKTSRAAGYGTPQISVPHYPKKPWVPTPCLVLCLYIYICIYIYMFCACVCPMCGNPKPRTWTWTKRSKIWYILSYLPIIHAHTVYIVHMTLKNKKWSYLYIHTSWWFAPWSRFTKTHKCTGKIWMCRFSWSLSFLRYEASS